MCVLRFGVLLHHDKKNNAVLVPGPYPVPDAIQKIHTSAFVADLHADSLLWKRDLRKRYTRGQVDLPRLKDGGVDLQVFGVVTKVPNPISFFTNSSDTDSLPLLFLASWRSPATWFNPKERALTQANEIVQLANTSQLTLVLRKKDMSVEGIKGLLALEGMHALNGEETSLLDLYSAGFRMMGLAHFFDNEVAGSIHGVDKIGLTQLGRRLIPQMEALGITIDLAHVSNAAFDETLDLVTKPVVVSHVGVAGTCPGPRSLTDTQLQRIAKNGGVIGVGFWKRAICNVSVKGITAAILHAINVAGIDHVGLGSDFDGNVTTPFDTTGLPMLTEALLGAGLPEEDVLKVLGGNVRRVLTANLPE
ncbi:MAG: membrane dipeptidase [Porticoccus sp.]|nr:membrane dipeptidase [Porticoccus sp.]